MYHDRNLFVTGLNGSNKVRVTTDGSVEKRIKNGSASWVYGEENSKHDFYLYDLSGKLINAITSLNAEAATIVKVDEIANTMWYTARDGDKHLKLQLHRVGLGLVHIKGTVPCTMRASWSSSSRT